jgi:hypothetical protein
MNNHTEVVYQGNDWPLCDIEHVGKPPIAQYDAKTPQGPWAYLCEPHFLLLGCQLGMGLGQRLIKKENDGE